MRMNYMILIGALLAGTWQSHFLQAAAKEVPPEEFIISFWLGLPPEDNTPERFREMADAGFNLVMPGYVPAPDKAKSINLNILNLSAKHGMKAMIADPRITEADPSAKDFSEKVAAAVADYVSHPALYGYFVADEPGNSGIPRVAAICQALLAKDSKHLPFVNLLPIHATSCLGGYAFTNADAQFPQIVKDYDNHLERYLTLVKPKLLSYDEYDLIEGGGPIPLEGNGMLGMYFPNLEKIRDKGLKYRIPFNNIILVTPHKHAFGTYRDPTFEELRFLVYTTLAYGGRGIMYFTYASVPEFGSDGIIARNGKKSKHYDEVSRLNREIRALARVFCTLRSEEVYHVGRMPKLGRPLPKDGLVRQVDGADAVVSYFFNAEGLRYVMVVNKDYAKGHSIAITFRQPVRLETISPLNGQTEAIPDTSPGEDLQETSVLSFGPGEGKLFKVGELKMSQSRANK
jgi:hypothetical protein